MTIQPGENIPGERRASAKQMSPGKRRHLLRGVMAGRVTVEEYVAVIKRETDELLALVRREARP